MKRILIIDQDQRTREALRAIFSSNYQLSLASNIAEAQPFLASHTDLLIYGWTTAKEYLGFKKPNCPTLVLSVSPLSIPDVEVLAKPFDVTFIRNRVAELTNSQLEEPTPEREAAPAPKPIPEKPQSTLPINLKKTVNNFERGLIVEALKECNGIQTHTARMLGTTRRILRYRMEKLGIPLPSRKRARPNLANPRIPE